jgi:hypothetical protein
MVFLGEAILRKPDLKVRTSQVPRRARCANLRNNEHYRNKLLTFADQTCQNYQLLSVKITGKWKILNEKHIWISSSG